MIFFWDLDSRYAGIPTMSWRKKVNTKKQMPNSNASVCRLSRFLIHSKPRSPYNGIPLFIGGTAKLKRNMLPKNSNAKWIQAGSTNAGGTEYAQAW